MNYAESNPKCVLGAPQTTELAGADPCTTPTPGDVLVVWKLDRLRRSLPHLLTIVMDLKQRGVAFRSLTEQMDTTTPHGELLFGIFGSLAQYERALTRERVVAGLGHWSG